jgi:hypothetical protein
MLCKPQSLKWPFLRFGGHIDLWDVRGTNTSCEEHHISQYTALFISITSLPSLKKSKSKKCPINPTPIFSHVEHNHSNNHFNVVMKNNSDFSKPVK